MKLKRKEQPVNDSDEEFSVDSEGFVKNRGEVKSSRSSKSLSNYLEASSDDEFAKEHFILPSASDDEDQSGKKRKRKGKDKGKEKGKDDSDGEADKIDYRIQFILGKSVMPQKEWRKITDGINTRELTKFSVWQQPDEEYYDDSDVPVEKFLIKWAHASFLHVSWETEKDLVDMVGTSARHHIKKFRLREFEGTELFEDLSKGEYYPQSFIQIERVLDVDDPEVNMLEVDWENSTIPPIAKPSIPSESSGEDLDYFDSADADENKSGQCKQPRKKRKVSKKSKMNYLHSDNVWLTVKWEGLPYSEVSFESLQDLISRGIEYERPLRFFFRREQKQFDIKSKKDRKAANRNLIVDQTVIGSDSTPPKFPAGELRDYQWEGVRWMLFNLVQGRNCILADEMGLGKTIQSAALLQMIKNHSQNSGPFLVIAPLSTIVNWQREINGWTNLDVILYYGSQEDRDLIRSYEFRFLDKNCQGNKIEVLITTPETCVAVDDKSTTRIRRELSSIDWDLVIIDEAHKLKNYDSKLASTLREEYSFKNCVLLTGTPLQNNTEELWNLLNFIARDDFNDRESFIENFGELKTATQLEKLHKRIKPYLLRREKEFVEKSVPPKEEIVVEVELTVPQKQYYRAIYEQKTGFLYKQGGKDGPSLSNLAMELRKCCNHPFLIKGAAVEISKHFKNDSAIDVLVKTSGKMTLLDKLLPKLFHDGHRVLIFSQFRMMLDIIEDYIHAKGYFYDRVDGSIVGKKRQAAIDRFSNNDNVFIMLLSTKAGGVGINLTAADTVIIFDSDWNPQNDVQAQARAHRIGQTKPVTVYRLLTKKTYEMVMFRAASIKLGLDYAVMHNLKGSVEVTALPTVTTGKTRRAAAASGLAGISAERAEHVSSLSKRELENLLKHGAYDMFLEEKEGTSENESRFFVESSIEQILEKSSTFLHRENDSQVECTKTSSFAKASFISATGGDSTNDGEEVAIDDPDFWTKVVGLSVEDAQIQLGAKRKCRQFTESYREPTDSIKSIYGSHQAAYVTDSDESTAEEKGGKRKKRRKAEPEIVSAEFTADNLNAVLLAAVGYGYGNWKLIRKHSKMYWKDEDLAKAARIGMLFLLLAVSIQSEASVGAKSTNEDANNSEEVEDAEKENVCEEGNLTPADVATSNVEERSIRFENKVILATINKYRAIKLALKVYFDNFKTSSVDASKIEDNYLIQFKTFLESKQLEQVTVKALKESYQEFLQLSFDTVESIDNLVIELTKDELVQKLLSNEKELTKTAKKAALKAKMTVLEDLYECKLFDKIVNRKVAACLPISMEKKMDDEDEEYVEPVIDRKKDINTELFASEFETLTTANDTPSWWSTYYDSQALAIVSECGWPDSKKRFAMIVESLKANAIPGSVEEKEVEQQNLALEEAKIQQKLEKERQKAKERELEKELIEEDKMDVVATEPTDQTKNPEPDAAVAVVAIPKTAFDLLTSKFLLQRLKILTRHFRCTDEDQSALEKAAAKAEKSLAAAKNAEKNLRKKNVTNLLKTIQRIGYPRSTYENIPQPERVVDSSYLLNWENFIKDADITLTIDEAKEITYEAIDVFNRLDEYKDKEVIMEDGLLADIPVKLIEPTFEKTELVHQIRLLLSFHSEIEIVDFIRENCKVTGPNIPTYKRDTNMPVWWTQQQHDIQLLKLSIQNGCSQWKKVASEDVFAYPEGYVIPPKVNGQEWVTQVNPKALEKRIFAILRGVPSIKSFPTAPPSSPQKKIAANSKNAIVAAPSVKNVWFKKSEPSGSVASLAKVVTPIPPSPIVATPVRETVVVPIDIISSEAKVVPSQPKEVISIDEDEPILVEQVTPAHEETALSIVSNHNTPTNFIESLQSITESDLSIKEVEQMKVEEKEKTLDNITVLEIDIDQTKAKENSTTVVPATPVTPQATVSTEPPKTEAKKAKQAASSNPSENAGKGKKGKTEVKPPVQSKGIMHFFAKK